MSNGRKIKNNIYLVEWQDAHSNSGWMTKQEVDDFINQEKCIIRQTGWILSETESEIVISSRRTIEAEKNNLCEWGMLQKIPKAWVKKRILLRKI